MSAASVTVVVAISITIALALVGWRSGGRARTHVSLCDSELRIETVAAVVVAGTAAVAAVVAPLVAVLWISVVLNFTLGRGESLPFSTYPMFSRPRARWWALRMEGPNGSPVTADHFGLDPVSMHKRFELEVRVASTHGVDERVARLRAAEVLAAMVESHRPAHGPWSNAPITFVVLDYILAADGVHTRRTELIERQP